MSRAEPAPKDKGTVLAEERTNLALHRTIIAAERTLMAWIRTALSMIGFGFTIYKFFQYQAGPIAAGHAPRNLGLSLIALGTVALAAATWQHRVFLTSIGVSAKQHMISISVVIAMVVILIGVITFYGVLLRVGPF